MQSPDTNDAPLVPYAPAPATETNDAARPSGRLRSDGGRTSHRRPFDRPPETDYATDYTRDEAEIEPLVPDLR